jgi:ketosteroid isomerase-like protein
MKTFTFLMATFLILTCCDSNSKDLSEQWKQEIRDSEDNFAALLNEKGLHDAFVAYAAEDATIMRNNKVISGKKAIDEHYKNVDTKTLTWSSDFVDVSKSGDLGYTYGTYQFTYKDSIGEEHVDTGIFHTVWKRQQDGSWKYVWD